MPLIARPATKPPGHALSDKGDFLLFDGEDMVGQIYQLPERGNDTWFWTLCVKVSDHREIPCGFAGTLLEAQNEFKLAYHQKK